MGDQIYPGVYLSRVDPKVSENDIIIKIKRCLREYGAGLAIEEGGLKVELLRNRNRNNNAVIHGILLPFNKIRDMLKGRLLGDRPIYLSDVDFGVQRSCNGLFENHADNMFHRQLKEGQGFIHDKIKPLQENFVNKVLGGDADIGQTIGIIEDKINLNIKMLWNIPGFFQYSTNEELEKGVTGTMLHFLSAMETMQAIYYLNGDANFSKQGVRFKTTSETTTTPGKGLGIEGQLVNVQEYMKRLGYVPFYALRQNMFDQMKLRQTWASRCAFCSHYYTLKGISPDFYWIAATCACDTEKASYTWPGEEFFRLTLASTFARRHEGYQKTNGQSYEPLTLLVKGLTPLFSSVSDFQHSAFAAEKMENQIQRNTMAEKFQKGQIRSDVLSIEKIEKRKKKKKIVQMEFINVELWTKTTDLWGPDGMQNIRKVKLIPVEVKGDWPTLVELRAKMNSAMTGKLQRMWIHENQTVVELTMWVKAGCAPLKGASFFMIPIPTSCTMESITTAQRHWRGFLHARKKVTPIQTGRMNGVSKFSTDYITDLDENTNAHKMTLETETNGILDMILDNEFENVYYGIMLVVGAKQFPGVIVTADKKTEDPDHVIMTVYFKTNKRDLVPHIGTIKFYMWLAYQDESKYPADMKELMFYIPEEKKCKYRVDDSDSENDSDEEDFQLIPKHRGVDSDDDEEDEKEEDVEQEEKEEEEEIFANEESRIFKRIQKCPFIYKGEDMRDFLLETSTPRVSHLPPPTANQLVPDSNLKYSSFLNTSQSNAVRGMLRHYIHATEGPPGCGKSYTCCVGVLELYARNSRSGMILCAAQTNLAAQVLMETLHKVMDATGHRLVVRRMTAQSKEMPVPKEQSDEFVHSAILNHPKFTSNESVQEILKKKRENKRSLLKEAEMDFLQNATDRVRGRVLDDTDVLICTIGAATDGRLETYCGRKGAAQLVAIFLDEANLVTVGSTLSLLALNPKRFWMMGDYNQLTACFSSTAAVKAAANTSWMQMLTATEYGKKMSQMTRLTDQYRFPDGICKVVSEWCYGRRLKCSQSVLRRPKLPFNEAFYKEFPELSKSEMLRVTYDREECTDTRMDGSFVNEKECQIVESLIEKLMKGEVPQKDITVLAMYQSQVKKLSLQLASKYTDISIYTADCFEGREAPVVIVSMVRSNEDNHVGFLREINRTNVAITRATKYLLFVSNEETFMKCKIPDVKRFYDILKSHHIEAIMM